MFRTVLGAHVNALQTKLIGNLDRTPGWMLERKSNDLILYSGGVSLGKFLGIGGLSISPSNPRSWKARLYS